MNLAPEEYEINAGSIDAVLNCNVCDQGGMAVGRETQEAKLILERINLKRQQMGLGNLDLDNFQPVVSRQVEHKQFKTARENVKFIESITTDLLTGKPLDQISRSLETTDSRDIEFSVSPAGKAQNINVENMKLAQVIEMIKANKIPNYIFVDLSRDEDFELAAQELGLTEEVEATGQEIVKIFDTGIRGGGTITETTSDGSALAGNRQQEMGVILELRQGISGEGEIDMDQLGLSRYPMWHIEEMLKD